MKEPWMKSKQLLNFRVKRSISMTTKQTPSSSTEHWMWLKDPEFWKLELFFSSCQLNTVELQP